MKETMITNCVALLASSIAIAVACKVTKSGLPLLGFLLVPTWNCNTKDEGGNSDEQRAVV